MILQSSSFYPILSHHIFWNSKSRFQLSVDTYEYWVLFAVESGSFAYRIGEAEGTARMGDVIVCPPGLSFHRSVIHALTFHFIGFTLESLSSDTLGKAERKQAVQLQLAESAYKLNIQHRNRLAENLKILKKHSLNTEDRNSYWQNHVLNDIWQFCRQTATAPVNQEMKLTDPLIEQAKIFIQQNCYEDFSMHNLAAELGISPVQLSRRFQRSVGTAPSRYLAALRINKAKSLLTETRLSLEQIAQACGYSNGFYLSRIFTKKMKISPSEYRKLNRV
ncbi:helix-turn-helix domain-containing protein [Paenibacillus sp. Soil522]|uniref:helix-turn-helix domain-containing protein n=1 Tax=Paenibacillus sp. Soil522 TaxID=1736388 RepID=UPI0006F61636|nr:AraC family transcriptional regulator [Paenibacillus sp. Soil522]KRE49558.1 AraC family transcriptional regulator [Paenibacillus sp. Soil522]